MPVGVSAPRAPPAAPAAAAAAALLVEDCDDNARRPLLLLEIRRPLHGAVVPTLRAIVFDMYLASTHTHTHTHSELSIGWVCWIRDLCYYPGI